MDNTKIFFISVMILFVTSLSSSEAKKAIEERITPVGQVCIEGQNCSEVVAKTDYSITGTRPGEEIYNGACNTCHGIGLAGAPKFGDRVSWGERANKDLDKLVANVTNGLNGMPPMGMCMDCSEEELTGSVQYMLDAFN
tara:strand:+ start:142 stop:558 length:417 start_codon:yes stop_codon:yes gene_type:complete